MRYKIRSMWSTTTKTSDYFDYTREQAIYMYDGSSYHNYSLMPEFDLISLFIIVDQSYPFDVPQSDLRKKPKTLAFTEKKCIMNDWTYC